MLQVGVLLHQAKSGLLIIRLSQEVKAGSMIVDEKGRKVGRVVELIGPARAPYASVSAGTSRFNRSGDPAFIMG